MVKTILWPTDLSKNSLRSAKHVVSLADKYQARVIMLYVAVDLATFLPSYGTPGEHHIQQFQSWELQQAKKKMETICAGDLKACPNLEIKLVQGDPTAEIIKMAKSENADMIVLTTHGRGHDEIDQKSAEFGSVAHKVMHCSPVPVHLVNPYQE
jgi:nucleotide-binding universal stress UspA family protein